MHIDALLRGPSPAGDSLGAPQPPRNREIPPQYRAQSPRGIFVVMKVKDEMKASGKDAALEDFLRDHRPIVEDGPLFLLEAGNKMKALDGIREEVDRQRRICRIALVLALVLGLVGGVALGSLMLLRPAIPWKAVSDLCAFAWQWRYVVFAVVPACAITLGIVLAGPSRRGIL